jgi:hypothetical protein
MSRYLLAVLLVVIGYLSLEQSQPPDQPTSYVATETQPQASQQWRSGQQVEGQGTVGRILSDDNDGSRHQRFILRLSSGQTLLVAHNIELAPRISSLREGDTVSFYGEYESNDKGGVIHWTHHDPQGWHVDGWLEHKGQRYQ